MMQQLRASTKAIMVLVSVSFVGLMVFEWGMDLSGMSSRQGTGTSLGSVNGATISVEEFQRQYQILYELAQRQSPDGTLTPEQLREIEQQAWEDMVDLTLLREEARERDIRLTDSELVEYIKYNPPPDVANLPAFQTDGRFDLQKYQAALADPALAQTWADYEAQLRRTLPVQKLQEQIVSGATVTGTELLDAYRARNERARMAYLYLDPDRLARDRAVQVSAGEIRSYYDRQRERYRREPSAKIRYVVFRPEVTAADSAAVRGRADSLAEVARATSPQADFAELARSESGDRATAQSGGDLGWVDPSTMAPAFEEALGALEPGQVSPAVQTDFGWHIIKLQDRQTQDGETLVHARHILLPIEPSTEAEERARQAAQSFARDASAKPEGFAESAAARGLEVAEPPLFERGIVVPSLGAAPAISDFVFSNEANSVSGAVEHDGAYYVIRVDDRYPAGYVALEQVQEEIRNELRREKELAAARELAPRVTEVVRQLGLEGAARRFGLGVVTTDYFTRTNNIPGIGSGTAVAGAAFGLAEGQVAGPIEGPRGVYFIQLLEKEPYDPQAFERDKEALRDQLRLAQMRESFNAWFEDLRERAEIEDNRAQMLGTT